MKLKIKQGTTSKIATVFIQDSSSTTGAGLAALVFNSASLTGYWIAEGDATATSITLATMTAGTWATGGFIEVDATNMPGVYQVGIPDLAIDATSEGSVVVMLKGATNMAPVLIEIELDAIDYKDATRLGLTALPNAAADAAGGLAISDAGGLDIDGKLANTNEITAARMGALTDWINGGRLDLLLDAIPTTAMRGTDGAYTGTPPTAAAVADAVWDELQSAHVTVGSFGIIASEIAAIPTTAMRGTDSAATAASLATAQLDLDTITGADGVNLLSATQATLDDVPTTAEFEARTLVAASYFDPAADAVANVTTVATTTTNSDMLTAASILTTQMTEAYAADGVAPTLAQSLFLIQQALTEVAIVSTTETIKKLDGSTAAATLTLDDASSPTSKTRAT